MQDLLLNFDYSNWKLILLFLIPALINFGICLFVFIALPKNTTNIIFFVFVLLLGMWQFTEGLMHLSLSGKSAVDFLRISETSFLFVVPAGFLFILKFTGWNKKIPASLIFIFFFAPAILFLFFAIAKIDKYSLVPSAMYGWIINPASSAVTTSIYLWYAFCAITMLLLLWVIFYKEKSNNILRKQFLLLAVGFTVPILFGVIAEIILPLFFGIDDIPVSAPLITAFSVTAIIAIKKFGFLDYSPLHQWDTIIETINEGILIVDNAGKIMYANKIICEMTGYDLAEVQGKIAHELFLDDDQESKKIKQTFIERENKSSGQYEIRIRTKSGEKKWMLINGSPYLNQNGKVIGSIGIHTDITKRKQAEELIIKSEERYRDIVENITDLICTHNLEGRILSVNASAEKFLGYSQNELLKMSIQDILVPGVKDQFANYMITLKTNSYAQGFMKVRTSSGDIRIWEYSNSLRTTGVETPIVRGLARDVTEQIKADKKIKLSEARLSEAQRVAKIGSWETDLLTLGVIWSEEIYRIFEIKTENFLQSHQSFLSFVHPEDREKVDEAFAASFNSRTINTIDHRIVTSGGLIKFVEERWQISYDNQGLPIRAIGTCQDITERKQAEEKLQKSLIEISDYKFALDQSSIVVITDPNGTIQYVNDNFCKISKFSREELIGQNSRILNSGYHSKEFFGDLWKTISAGKVWTNEVRNKAKDGTYFWLDTTIIPFLDEKGKIYQYIAIRNDVSKRKKAEEEFQLLIKTTTYGFWIVDVSDGKMLEVNETYCRMIGFSREELLQMKIQDVEAIESPEEIKLRIANILNQGFDKFESRHKTKSGKLIDVEIIITFSSIEKNKFYVFLQNITDRKQGEMEREKLIKELSNKYNELMQFNYIVSHNLRAPVANLLGLSNLITMPNRTEHDKLKIIKHIQDSATRMDDLIKDLNEILSARSLINIRKEKVYIQSLIASISNTLEKQIKISKSSITIHIPEEASEIYTIKSYLESILYNLINNAIKYKSADRKPQIIISTKKEHTNFIITVSDNGMGIDLEKQGKSIFGLYKRFYLEVEGKGLGLYMTKTQVEALGGTISIESEVNKGTVFTITLPIKIS